MPWASIKITFLCAKNIPSWPNNKRKKNNKNNSRTNKIWWEFLCFPERNTFYVFGWSRKPLQITNYDLEISKVDNQKLWFMYSNMTLAFYVWPKMYFKSPLSFMYSQITSKKTKHLHKILIEEQFIARL